MQSVVGVPDHYCVWAGKQEEGGIAIALNVRSLDELNAIINRSGLVFPSFLRVQPKTFRVEITLELVAPLVCLEQLRAHAHRWFDPIALRLGAAATAPNGKLMKPSPCCMDHTMAEQYLTQAVAQMQLRRPDEFIHRVAGSRFVRLLSISSQVHRLNDYDDAGLESLTRRERPHGAATMFTHHGLAVCCALLSGTPEQKAKQSQELSKVASQYETCFGIRFFVWDAAEGLKVDPKDPFPKEKLSRLLDAIKAAVPSSALPALLIFDLFKKRYYRTRLVGNLTFYPAMQIASFCDDFLKGSLNELLPPVRGCRAIGAGISNTKYSLIAL